MTNEELDQVAGGNIFSSISAAAAQRAAWSEAIYKTTLTLTETRAKTPDPAYSAMNHYIID